MSRWRARTTLGMVLLALAPFPRGQGRTSLTAPTRPEGAGPRSIFEGLVVDTNGAPVEGAVVVSSAGGTATTGRMGTFRLEASVPPAARTVEITAVDGGDPDARAITSIELAASSGFVRVGPLALTSASERPPSWLSTFGGLPGTDERVSALTVFDDGSGPALFAAGLFTTAGGVAANRIAKWDGSRWRPLASGVDADVLALTVFDDGGGPALYAGGEFTTAGGGAASHVARWDGASWAPLGSGLDSPVHALAVFDDGSGPALYAGGSFTTAGGGAASSIAR